MTLAHSRRSCRRLGAGLAALLVLTGVTVLVAACGGSSQAATNTTGRSVQVLATVRRGDLVESAVGRLQLTSTKGEATGLVQVTGQSASQVAAGQAVTLVFIQRPAGAGQGSFGQGGQTGSGQGQGAPSGFPSSAAGGGQGAAVQGFSGGGSGFFGGGGQTGRGAFGGKTAQGTVTSVKPGSNGSVSATVAIAKLPAGVTAKYMGIAQIQVKVLASNVLIIPTAAIKGSGGNATVQLLSGGKTATQKVVVGRHDQFESEIVSGLSQGQSVVYTRTFTGRFPGSRSGQGFQGGGQSGAPGFFQNGGQSNGSTNGL